MNSLKSLTQELEKAGITFSCSELLSLHTSFRIGGPADVFCSPKTENELIDAISICKSSNTRFYLLGKGSNALFKDDGFRGVIICTAEMSDGITVNGTTISAAGGASLMRVCRTALNNGLTGLEFAFGIPGSVGGAVYMNAGAYGGEMKDILSNVTFLDENGHIQSLLNKDLELGYRTSIFARKKWCILKAEMQMQQGDKAKIKSKMDDLMARRVEKQPLEYPSAGSTFKRPEGAFAGELIQRCGLRGKRIGDAAISEKHCGFVINLGNAKCSDVLELTQLVHDTVKEQTGFILEKEIRVIE